MAPAARERRSAQLAPAQQLSETLMAAVELENPYTRQTMTSLKSQMEQLEKASPPATSFSTSLHSLPALASGHPR